MFDFRHVKVLDDIKSPIVKALIKKQINDKVDIKSKNYQILKQNIQRFKKKYYRCSRACKTCYLSKCMYIR